MMLKIILLRKRKSSDLETKQKSIEEAAKVVVHTKESDRQKEVRRTPEKVREKEQQQDVNNQSKRKGAQETSKESQGRTCCEM